MKIDINTIKQAPSQYAANAYCVHKSQATVDFIEWLKYHKFDHFWSQVDSSLSPQFLNFYIPDVYDISTCFISPKKYDYVDGFSPNLNKNLHLGHLSNFIIAKSFQSMGIGNSYIAHLGDTLDGDIKKHEALESFMKLIAEYDYLVDKIYFASEQITDKYLEDGTGDYEGTKIFDLGYTKVVGIKSDGSTTYFMQDVALATKIPGSVLYVTGAEQSEHFKNLSHYYPTLQHKPLGLVTLSGVKMASRKGNVIWMTDVFDMMKDKFGDNKNLIWNILCGHILKSNTSSSKSISVKDLDNVKSSFGLYLSYTIAKLKSAGLKITPGELVSTKLKVAYYKSVYNLEPNILLNELVSIAKELSSLYEQYKIKDTNNHYKFAIANDLLSGMILLGMKDINKV